MGTERILMQVRLPRVLVRQVAHWAVDHDMSRQAAVEHLINVALPSFQQQDSKQEADPHYSSLAEEMRQAIVGAEFLEALDRAINEQEPA